MTKNIKQSHKINLEVVANKALLSREETAAYLGISVPTLDKTVKSGRLPKFEGLGSRVLIRKSDIDAFLANPRK